MEGGKEGKKNREGGKTLVTKIPEMGKEGGDECRGSGSHWEAGEVRPLRGCGRLGVAKRALTRTPKSSSALRAW